MNLFQNRLNDADATLRSALHSHHRESAGRGGREGPTMKAALNTQLFLNLAFWRLPKTDTDLGKNVFEDIPENFSTMVFG